MNTHTVYIAKSSDNIVRGFAFTIKEITKVQLDNPLLNMEITKYTISNYLNPAIHSVQNIPIQKKK